MKAITIKFLYRKALLRYTIISLLFVAFFIASLYLLINSPA
jgi:preprotein translocase subunit SecE